MSSTVLPCSGIATWFPFFFHQSWPCTGRRKMCSSPWLPSWVWMSRWGHRLPQVKARIWKIEHVTMQHPTWCFFGRGSYTAWMFVVQLCHYVMQTMQTNICACRRVQAPIVFHFNFNEYLYNISVYIQVKSVSGVSVPFHPKPQGIHNNTFAKSWQFQKLYIYMYN